MEKRIIFIGLITLLAYSCSQPEQIETKDTLSENANTISFSKSVMDKNHITLGHIEQKTLSKDISARGQVVLLPEKMADVSVLMGGTLQSFKIARGQKVNKGDVLATYSNPEFINIQQQYLINKAELDMKTMDFNRQRELWEQQVKSDKEFQQAQAEFSIARANFEASKAKLKMLSISEEKVQNGMIKSEVSILSPIGGTVDRIFVKMGEYLDVNQAFCQINDLSNPIVQLNVFEKDIQYIKTGQRVTFQLTSSVNKEYEAKVKYVGVSVEDAGRVINVMVEITNDIPDLIPGMFVSSVIHTGESVMDALPETAIIIENDTSKYSFYTLGPNENDTYEFFRFYLETGLVEDDYVQVKLEKPLPENAFVVTHGVYYLKSEMLKNLE
ncbi:MAG: efflux RND transporter periplasmic adaptor subunit [Bacteroidales bacterium]|nr:efflux RND transporter periplasmic adaptor subunit [Bacteroidales bacterium]